MTSVREPETPEQLLSRHGHVSRGYAVLIAWQAGEMTEMEAANILGYPVVQNREHVQELLAVARALSDRFRQTGETVQHDLLQATIAAKGYRILDD